jgi:dihydrofolate synthase / folylpolyglutamate synthase
MHSTLTNLYLKQKQFGRDINLESMQKLQDILQNPHYSFKSIHVAGSNGKGSTASFIASMLRHAGYKVGLYTSPHLMDYNERIQINGRHITNSEISNILNYVEPIISQSNLNITFFELTTTLAFLHFRQQQVDFAVIEVGLGGRLDATNVITPEVSVITNISLEHTKALGSTLEKIALEKAGIVKSGVPLVTTETNPSVIRQFRHVCGKNNTTLRVVQPTQHLSTSLPGKHQQLNAALAVATVSILQERGHNIPSSAIEGLKHTQWPGRLQTISTSPKVIVDCAHNLAGLQALKSEMQNKSLIIIFGLSHSEDIINISQTILPHSSKIIICDGHSRLVSSEIIATAARKHCSDVTISTTAQALDLAKASASSKDTILVTGSIYLVGEILKQFDKQGKEQIQQQN